MDLRRTMVRYRVQPDRADENEALVRAVYAELAAAPPDGLRYATIRLEDGTFVHLAETDGAGPLQQVAAFRAFQAELRERCAEPPTFQRFTPVGAFRWPLGG